MNNSEHSMGGSPSSMQDERRACWARIPAGLRARRAWVLAAPDKSPWSPSGARASSTRPETWDSFEHACAAAAHYGCGIGYMLHASDPFTCIDLDVVDEDSQRRKGQQLDPSKWTTAADFDRYWHIVQYLRSYTERSTYGKGLHIWVRGKIGSGIKRDGVEVYSQERFIICTGDAVLMEPIQDRQDVLDQIVHDMRGYAAEPIADESETFTDEEIFYQLLRQRNGTKFLHLWHGEWREYGYPSQSEADEALLSFLCFRCKNNAQVRRLFRTSALGKRKKAHRDDYLNRTILRLRVAEAARDLVLRLQRKIVYAALGRPL